MNKFYLANIAPPEFYSESMVLQASIKFLLFMFFSLSPFVNSFSGNNLHAQTCADVTVYGVEVVDCSHGFYITGDTYAEFIAGNLDAYTLDFGDGYIYH